MERPLHPLLRDRNRLLALARALLYCPQTAEEHGRVLLGAFETEPSAKRVRRLAERTVQWTSSRPQPRCGEVIRALQADALLQRILERHPLRQLPLVGSPATMRALPDAGQIKALETVLALADWLRLDPEHVLWFADLKDRNRRGDPLLRHYESRVVLKADGTVRLIEMPKQRLKSMQRQILREILMPIPLHAAVHGFRPGRSIVSFAAPHASRAVVLRLDLRDFFPSISGPRVQALFRTLGYPEHVADLLGGLCTTTASPATWRGLEAGVSSAEVARVRALYARPHLPQGAPTSPAVANLCAFRMDRRLSGLAAAAGAAYTRYADDLAFSGDVSFGRVADRFSRHVAAIAAEEGFAVHMRKTRVLRASVRQHLAGLTVNARASVPRRELERLEAILTNCVRFGPESQNREGHPEFRRYLEGKVSFAAMVGGARVAKLQALLGQIVWRP